MLANGNILAQKKPKFKTLNNEPIKYEVKWSGSMSYGNTIFAGDLHHESSERYLPNVALAIKFNKEFNPSQGYQIAIITGKNSGQNSSSHNENKMTFRSQYTQIYIAYRKSLSTPRNEITQKNKPQFHLITGLGYYYADASLTTTANNFSPFKSTDDVWSLVVPIGLELSYYIQENWGAILSLTNNMYARDNIDLYESNDNGFDNQVMINVGLYYKLN